MTIIGDHGLTCLDDSSYAAVALNMQANAIAINAALLADQAAYTAYGNSFVRRFVTTSANSGIGANSGLALPDGTAAQSMMVPFLMLPAGWYSMSASMTYQESGAVTALSYRRAILSINLGNDAIPPKFFQATTAASNTASADSMTVNGWFYSDGIIGTSIYVLFGHGNTASTMTVAAGVVLTVRFMTAGLVT